jgi:alkylation response protein AidB-like acyl-CoA dehydrogenase
MIHGDVLVALGYSEPGAGSDVASVRTRAVRDGDGWVIDGEKVFTTLAHESQYVFLLTRTDLDLPKHEGLTMFLVPMDTPGIEILPIHTLGGERTNSTYYKNVHVEDRWRVGEVNGGWDVMGVALTFERTVTGGKESVRVLQQFIDWAKEARDDDGRARIDDPAVREAIARVSIRNEIAVLLSHRANWIAASGGLPGVEGSKARLYYTTRFQTTCSELLDLVGPEAVLQHGEPDAPASGWIERAYRHSSVSTIYGGTSEVQRTIIARRGLRLPSSPKR